LLAGLFSGHTFAELNLLGVLDISGSVSTDVVSNRWSNSSWHIPEATILLATSLICQTLAFLDLKFRCGTSGFVSTGIWNKGWCLVECLMPFAWSHTSSFSVSHGASFEIWHSSSENWNIAESFVCWSEFFTSRPDARFLLARILAQLTVAGWSKIVPVGSGCWMAPVRS